MGLVACGLLLAGCGAAGRQARVQTLETELAVLRDENQFQREENERLKNRIALLEGRVEDAEDGRGAPKLRVVKLRRDEEEDEEEDDDEPRPSGKRLSIKIHESGRSLPVPAPMSTGGNGGERRPVLTNGGTAPDYETSGYPDPNSVNEKIPITGGKAPAIPSKAPAGVTPAKTPVKTATPAAAAAPGDVDAARAEAFFSRSVASFEKMAYADAESGFRQFLARYPRHPRIDQATYYLAETLYARGSFADAMTQFGVVTTRHPKSDKAPLALFKTALASLQLKQVPRAKELLAEVIRRHPRTEAAKLATARLSELLR